MGPSNLRPAYVRPMFGWGRKDKAPPIARRRQGWIPGVLISGQSLLGCLYDRGEGGFIANSYVCQRFAIELNVRQLQAVNKAAVA